MTISICIFAHNEEVLLHRCVGALEKASGGRPYQAHILVNGCTDNTLQIANTLAATDNRLQVHETMVADKATAWNDYVFRIAGPAPVHVFMDGDIQPSANAFSALEDALKQNSRAYGAAALPITGRSQRLWARRLIVNRYISGNLYALSDLGLRAFQENNIRLPYGAKGEDGLITYLLLTDMKGGKDDTHRYRVEVAPEATFEFDSLSAHLRHVKIYKKRLQRYAERHFQKQILYHLLKRDGVAAMPDNIYDIYTDESMRPLKPRLDPVNYWFDREALRKLRLGSFPGARRKTTP